MPVNMDFIHPIVQGFVQGMELAHKRKQLAEDKLQAAEKIKQEEADRKERARQADQSFKRLEEQAKMMEEARKAQQRLEITKLRLQTQEAIESGKLGGQPVPRLSDPAFNQNREAGIFGNTPSDVAVELPNELGGSVTGRNPLEMARQAGEMELLSKGPLAEQKSLLDAIELENQRRKDAEDRRKLAELTASLAEASRAKDRASRAEIAAMRASRSGAKTTASKVDSRVDSWLKAHDANPQTKRYILTREAVQFVDLLPNDSTSPADDQGLIYAFAKAMDPESVVREGEYATVQKYSQAWVERFKFSAQRVIDNKEFLTPQAREMMKNTIRAKSSAVGKEYQGYRRDIVNRIDEIAGKGEGEKRIGDHLAEVPVRRKLTDAEQLQLGRHKDPATGYWVGR